MKNIPMQYFDAVTIDLQTYKCQYCGKDLTELETERVDVLNLANQFQYCFCQTDECMSKHLKEFYKNSPGHLCYANGCLQ